MLPSLWLRSPFLATIRRCAPLALPKRTPFFNDVTSTLLDTDRDFPPRPQLDYFPREPSGPGNKNKKRSHKQRHLYKLHVFCSRNNTIATFARPDGGVIARYCGGECGFKRSQRAGYEAGYQVAVKIFARVAQVLEEQASSYATDLELCFRGFGHGRDAVQKALLSSEGEKIRDAIKVLTDRTPLKIGGTKAKKARRL